MKTWLTDSNGNRCSVEYFGSREAAQKALDSLKGCSDCSDCSGCSYCSGKKGGTGEPPIPVIPDIDRAVYAAASAPDALDMGQWHCGTTHCRAGWVVTLAGEEGAALEKYHNTELAAMLIYRESGSPINPARFNDSNEDALADMKKRAEKSE